MIGSCTGREPGSYNWMMSRILWISLSDSSWTLSKAEKQTSGISKTSPFRHLSLIVKSNSARPNTTSSILLIMLKLSVSISRPLHCIGGIVAIYSCHLWKDMKRYEKIWNTHYTMGESMSRQYWVHPIQVRSLELLATVEYHLYRRILFSPVRSCMKTILRIFLKCVVLLSRGLDITNQCLQHFKRVSHEKFMILSTIIFPVQWYFDQFWAILDLLFLSTLSNPRPFYLKTYECIWKHMNVYETMWMYMKTYECIWKHVNVYGNIWKAIMKVIENSATRASCHLSCWVWTNFVRMKSRWLKQVNKSG